jgi:hypothetical protein
VTDPHLTQMAPGMSAQTLCGPAVVGYGSMLSAEPEDWAMEPPLCPACRKYAALDD